MHATGSRIIGFSRELFTAAPATEPPAAVAAQPATTFPYVAALATAAAHSADPVVGGGSDDQFEFAFALDLLLDGIERLHRRGWISAQ